MKDKKKIGKSVLRLLMLALCGVVLGVSVYSANAGHLLGEALPMPFGYGASVVLSGSMEPTLSTGDLSVVGEAEGYEEGDVVVFQEGRMLVVHRIVALDGDTVTTQGDANNVADAPISLAAVKGRVLFHIPAVGHVVNFLKSPVGIICTIAAALALVEIPRRNEKKRDDEERQKIIDEINRLREDKN